MSSFREAFSGKRSVCCALIVRIYNTVGWSIASIYDLGNVYLPQRFAPFGKYVTSGRIYWLKTSLPCYIYITFYYNIYIYQSGNRLHAGDNISWQAPIDGVPGCIENMLLAEDIKLPPLDTPLGIVQFVQVH